MRYLKQEHLQGHPEEVYGCEFLDTSTEAMQLASCSEEKVFLWDVGTGKQLANAGPPSDIHHEPTGTLGHTYACMQSWRMCSSIGSTWDCISVFHKLMALSQLPSAVVQAFARMSD